MVALAGNDVAEPGVSEPGVSLLVPDERGRLPGRGAWLHPKLDCLELAVTRRAFPRALRTTDVVDPAQLREWVAAR
ncbi:MAG: YlxR family protein [Microlunatus sp.]|nr:YlxR family protein [Microlunatus sp.]